MTDIENKAAVIAAIKEALAPLVENIVFAGIFGSYARGEARPDSDVDGLVIVDGISSIPVHGALYGVEESVGRPVSGSVYDTRTFRELREEGSGFVHSVLTSPLIALYGDSVALDSFE